MRILPVYMCVCAIQHISSLDSEQLDIQGKVRIRRYFIDPRVVIPHIGRHKHRAPPTLTHACHGEVQRRRRLRARGACKQTACRAIIGI